MVAGKDGVGAEAEMVGKCCDGLRCLGIMVDIDDFLDALAFGEETEKSVATAVVYKGMGLRG